MRTGRQHEPQSPGEIRKGGDIPVRGKQSGRRRPSWPHLTGAPRRYCGTWCRPVLPVPQHLLFSAQYHHLASSREPPPHPTPTTMCHVGLRIVGVCGLEARAACFRDLARLTGRRETTKEHFYSRVLKQSSSGHLGLCVGSGL